MHMQWFGKGGFGHLNFSMCFARTLVKNLFTTIAGSAADYSWFVIGFLSLSFHGLHYSHTHGDPSECFNKLVAPHVKYTPLNAV